MCMCIVSHWKQCKFASDLNFKSFITLLKLAIRNVIFYKQVILNVLYTNIRVLKFPELACYSWIVSLSTAQSREQAIAEVGHAPYVEAQVPCVDRQSRNFCNHAQVRKQASFALPLFTQIKSTIHRKLFSKYCIQILLLNFNLQCSHTRTLQCENL